MKLKQFFAAALLLVGAGASAQTDVTTTYLTNADFEGNYSSYSKPNSDRDIYQPTGWTITYTNGEANDLTSLNSSCTQWNQFSGRTQPTNGGSNTYWIRFRWGSSEALQLSQTMTLPKGFYSLSADAFFNGSTATAIISAAGQSTTINTKNAWKNYSVSFTLEQETEVTIALKLTQKKQEESVAAFDNFKLTWTDPDAAANAAKLEAAKYSLNGYIKKATAMNAVLSDATLTGAIETAQGVYDAANDYATHYDDVVSGASNLNDAITAALVDVETKTPSNAGFDIEDDWQTGNIAAVANANSKDVTDWTSNGGAGWCSSATFSYANGGQINSADVPSEDMFGNKAGGMLGFSLGWGGTIKYTQTIETLPAGKYLLYYEAYNGNTSSNTIGANLIGLAGNNSTVKDFGSLTWGAYAMEIDITAPITNGEFVVGATANNNTGSGGSAKFVVDNVALYYLGWDSSDALSAMSASIGEAETLLESKMEASVRTTLNETKTAAAALVNETSTDYDAISSAQAALNQAISNAETSINIYTSIDAAITNAEAWTATSAVEAMRTKYNNGTYANDVTAANIYAEYQAAEIETLGVEGKDDFTSVILNHSFETGNMTGWSAESRSDTGVKQNSNATYTTSNVDGDYLFNSWGGTAENNVYQTIPNLPAGTYQLSALLAGFNGETLVLAANEETNSVVVAGDKTVGYTVNVIFTLDAASDVTIKASNTKGVSTNDASFIKADNFTLKAYNDPLAAYKEQLATLQAEATTTLGNAAYVNVTGSEKTTLKTLSTTTPEETEEAYTTAISGITAAISAFTAAKDSYDALVTEIAYAKTIGVTTADDYAATSESTTASVVTSTQNLKVAEFTAVHYNTPNVVTPLLGTWNQGNYGTTSGQGYTSDESYFDKWNGSAMDLTSSATVTLPAGKYAVKVAGRGVSSTTMSLSVKVGDADAVSTPFLMNGDTGKGIDTDGNTNFDENANYSNNNVGRGWQYRYITFTTEGEDVTITINGHLNANTWQSFYAPVLLCDNETFANIYAGDAEYTALSNAIDAAEAKTLGFEDGQYAPYNNVAALEALAAAKAIDQTAQNKKAIVEAATTALTSSTWTANDGDVDAVYNGTFAETGAGNNPKGWSRSNNGWGQQITELSSEANGVAEGTTTAWYYNTNGAWEYGKEGAYTMPLAENQTYKLSFKYSKHGNDWQNWMKASVVNDNDEGLEVVQFAAAENGTNFVTAEAIFTTGEAGNYILSIEQNGNAHLTDVSLVKLGAELALSDVHGYKFAMEPTNIETVTLNRTVKEGFNTVCLPFNLTANQVAEAFGEGSEVYTFSEESTDPKRVVINFNKGDGSITANVPVLLKAPAESTSQTFEGVQIVAAEEAKVEGTNFDFVGVYAPTTVEALDYFIGNGAIYKSAGNTNIKAFRAFIDNKSPEITGSSQEVKMFIGGIETAISEINDNATENGTVYNLAGQRVNKAQKGLYIVNGKKVIVK